MNAGNAGWPADRIAESRVFLEKNFVSAHLIGMTDTQLYLAIGLPVFAVMMNMIAGIVQHSSTQSRFTSLESTMNGRFSTMESTMNGRFTSLENRFETLTGEVIEMDNRLTRLETWLERR
jgi:hypothetical protein